MKQKDIITIIVAAVVSTIIASILAKILFASPKNRQQKVEVVPSISSNFPTPDSKYFNYKSIDPTQNIQIGTSTNSAPFNSSPTP